MRQHTFISLTLLPFTLSQTLYSLTTALEKYPNLSNFTAFLNINPTVFDGLLSGNGSKFTLLIPSDTAITSYQSSTGSSLSALPQSQILPLLSYHVLSAPIVGTNFTQNGLVVPTLLTDEKYNNRTAGPALQAQFGNNANGQVLYFSTEAIPSTRKLRIKVRQAQGGGDTANVRAGVSEVAAVEVVDGVWDGGVFQIVDQFVLTNQITPLETNEL
jgi:fasciclin domain-containing protein